MDMASCIALFRDTLCMLLSSFVPRSQLFCRFRRHTTTLFLRREQANKKEMNKKRFNGRSREEEDEIFFNNVKMMIEREEKVRCVFFRKKEKKRGSRDESCWRKGSEQNEETRFFCTFQLWFLRFPFLAIFLCFIKRQKPSIKGRGKFVTRMGWEIFICIFQD